MGSELVEAGFVERAEPLGSKSRFKKAKFEFAICRVSDDLFEKHGGKPIDRVYDEGSDRVDSLHRETVQSPNVNPPLWSALPAGTVIHAHDALSDVECHANTFAMMARTATATMAPSAYVQGSEVMAGRP
jgi:hypothetical protein